MASEELEGQRKRQRMFPIALLLSKVIKKMFGEERLSKSRAR